MKTNMMLAALVAGVFVLPNAQASENLILNGDFASSNVASGSYLYANGVTSPMVAAAYWSFADGVGIANHSSAWGGVASTGAVAFIQNINLPTISQAFSSTSSAYSVSFDLAQRPINGIEHVTVTLDNQTVVANLAPSNASFAKYTFNVSGLTGSSHILKFQGVNPTSSDSSLFLDNVNVSAVPEPETYAMLLAGLGLMGAGARRRRNGSA